MIDDLAIFPWHFFVMEDFFKLMGASFWMLYALVEAWRYSRYARSRLASG